MLSRTSTSLLVGLEDLGNARAWRRFYGRYAPMLLSYAKRVGLSDADAQDAVAETLVAFVQAYQAGRYDRDRARLKTWLGGIAQNKVRQLWARRASHGGGASLDGGPLDERSREANGQARETKPGGSRTPGAPDGDMEKSGSATVDPADDDATREHDEALEREWQLQRLSDAMDILRRECRPTAFQAFDLYALKSWSPKRVADFLGISPNAVYISKTRMLKKLREIVGRLEKEEE